MQSQPINHKNCPCCGSLKINKNGKNRDGLQRYEYRECNIQFQSSNRSSFQAKKLMSDYLFKNKIE